MYVVLGSILFYTTPLTGTLAFKSWVRCGESDLWVEIFVQSFTHSFQFSFSSFSFFHSHFCPSQTCSLISSAHCTEVYCSLQHPIPLNLFHIHSLSTDLKLKYPLEYFFPSKNSTISLLFCKSEGLPLEILCWLYDPYPYPNYYPCSLIPNFRVSLPHQRSITISLQN